MPSNVVKSFAKQSGKSESEVEHKWDTAKERVSKQYDLKQSNPRYWKLVTGILKKMLKLK